MDDDAVFRALADASRRKLLDRLHTRNGQTLGELCRGLHMTRQAVAKHLAILHEANLVAWKRAGREKLRSEERRVGKECRSRGWTEHEKKKNERERRRQG